VFVGFGRAEDEIDEEMRFHVELLAQQKQEAGLNAEEARSAAWRKFGNLGVLKEESREAWGWSVLDRLAQDLRHAFRAIVRRPLQAVLIVATLGLAMGANLAVFLLLDKVVLRPLPVAKPSQLVLISAPEPEPRKTIAGGLVLGGGKWVLPMDYPFFKGLHDRVHVLEGMSAYTRAVAKLATSGDPVLARGFLVTGSYFDMLGIKAQLGRTLTPADDREQDGDPAVVLTHGFWQRQFGGDPTVLHRTIRLNQQPMVVVGITAPGFTGTDTGFNADFFVPVSRARALQFPIPGFTFDAAGYDIYTVMARLAPGVDIQQAERATETVYRQLLADAVRLAPPHTAEENARIATNHVSLFPGGYAARLSSSTKTPLRLLMAMVVLVLIVAAGNVSNLLLARGTSRARETATRLALGSSRGRILREFLAESLLLTASAAIFGHFLASWTAHLLPVLLGIPNLPAGVGTESDSRSNWLALGLALIVGLGIWGASALRATKRSYLPALTENVGLGGALRATHWRRGLVVLQIAFSLILLCASFVLCRSLLNLMSVDPGFSMDNLYSFSVDYGQLGYQGAQEETLLRQIADRTRALPGVRRVALADIVPLSGNANIRHVSERPIPEDDQGTRSIIVATGPDYFTTLGISLTTGREFTPEDKPGNRKVALVNQALARILWGTSNPIGRRVWVGGASGDVEIVGVVKDIKGISLRSPDEPYLYLPVAQEPGLGSVGVVLRTAGAAVTLNAVRAAVKQVDSSVQVADFGSVADQISRSLYRDRGLAILSLGFAGLASILCAIGIFGLTSYSVAGRTQEIGVRIAFGANPGEVYWLVMREIVLLSFFGCSIGLAGFIAMRRIFTSLLFHLTPTDPVSLGWALLVLALTTFLAGFVPSHRAARLDPSVALRWE
jgi:predicted permease